MGDSEAVLGLDGLKEGLEGPGEERGDKTRPSVSSCSSRGSQMEVKLPWYMGITCQVRGLTNMRYDGRLYETCFLNLSIKSIERLAKFKIKLITSFIFDVCRM